MTEYYVGLMSGTSADGIDAALVTVGEDASTKLVAHRHDPYPDHVYGEINQLRRGDGGGSLDCAARLDVALAKLFATSALSVIDDVGLSPGAVRGIGSHGQTVRHHPHGEHGFTIQLANGAYIAEQTGITTVADFRTRDMAAGGQGAPLAPAFHRAVFHSVDANRVILNIGGIANITWLPDDPKRPTLGFDTGPGNTLMDQWTHRHLGHAYDEEGQWAQTGEVSQALLKAFAGDEFFRKPPPKSTDVEAFDLRWLAAVLGACSADQRPQDVQATLCRLTATTIADALTSHLEGVSAIYVCGGGTRNRTLMHHLGELVSPVPVATTSALGLAPEWVEASAFAWLAYRTLNNQPGNLPTVTGAGHPVVLGAIWPAQGLHKRLDKKT